MITPGLEGASYKPEFLWSFTPSFQETSSSEMVEKIFHMMIHETAVYGACILERRDYKFLCALHEACGFDRRRDGEDITFLRIPLYDNVSMPTISGISASRMASLYGLL